MAVLLGPYFGTHLVLKVSKSSEKIVSEGDEHRLARQKVISAWPAWEFQISGKKIVSEGDEHRLARQNVIFFISESRNYQVGTKIGPQKCPHMFFLIVGYLYSLPETE